MDRAVIPKYIQVQMTPQYLKMNLEDRKLDFTKVTESFTAHEKIRLQVPQVSDKV